MPVACGTSFLREGNLEGFLHSIREGRRKRGGECEGGAVTSYRLPSFPRHEEGAKAEAGKGRCERRRRVWEGAKKEGRGRRKASEGVKKEGGREEDG